MLEDKVYLRSKISCCYNEKRCTLNANFFMLLLCWFSIIGWEKKCFFCKCLYSHWLWHWVCHHWAKRHRRSGGPAWFCCCESSVCSSSSGWHRTGPFACYQGSGPSDDPPPPPKAPTPPEPVPVTLLQLQPSPDKPAPTGSAGQTALTRQSMGPGAAVCTVETTREDKGLDVRAATSVY